MLAQKSIPEKSSEIAAIQEVLADANLEGTTISIDAIGCQKSIAKQIIDKGRAIFFSIES